MGDVIITLTGHRNVDEETFIRTLGFDLVPTLTHNPGLEARWGGAPGADTLFAEMCHRLEIPLHLYLPDPGYVDRSLKGHWRQRHEDMAVVSESVHYSSMNPDWRNNFTRNVDMMTDAWRVYVAYKYDDIDKYTARFRPRKGGTSHGIMTALRLGFEFDKNLVYLPIPDPA